MPKRIKVNLCLLVIATTMTVGGFAATGILRQQPTVKETLNTRQNQLNVNRGKDTNYVNRSRLSPKLIMHLNALGNRLEKPGKERLTIMGELRSSASSERREITATLEFPDKLRLGIQNGHQNRLITFADQETKTTPFTDYELDLIESLSYDSAEHFFNAQMQGNAMRFLGSRFRMDDGSSQDYNGPYYDVYKIADHINASGEERPAKLYYFNSDTLLLERVTYVVNRYGSEINVETKLSDWRDEDGQKVARCLERLENGRSVFVLNIRSAQFARRTDDATLPR